MKSFKQFATLTYFTIFGILIKEITSTDYELIVDTDKGENKGLESNTEFDYDGPFIFYLKDKYDKEFVDEDDEFTLTLLYKSNTGNYKADCEYFDPKHLVCETEQKAIPGTLTIKPEVKTVDSNKYTIKENENVVNKKGETIAGDIDAIGKSDLRRDGNNTKFDINLENPLPFAINQQLLINVNDRSRYANCNGKKDDKIITCTIPNSKTTDKVVLLDDEDFSLGNYNVELDELYGDEVKGSSVPGIAMPIDYKTRIDRNHLGGSGILSIVLAGLAGLVGLGLCIYGCKPYTAPVIPEVVPFQPILTPLGVTPPQPIVIDNAHPVIPSPMPQPLPTPILPPPRPVVPIIPQPVVVPLVQPAQIQAIQPTPYVEQVVETPVVEPVVTDLVQPVATDLIQPVQDFGIVNEPFVDQGLGDFEQPMFTTGDQF